MTPDREATEWARKHFDADADVPDTAVVEWYADEIDIYLAGRAAGYKAAKWQAEQIVAAVQAELVEPYVSRQHEKQQSRKTAREILERIQKMGEG